MIAAADGMQPNRRDMRLRLWINFTAFGTTTSRHRRGPRIILSVHRAGGCFQTIETEMIHRNNDYDYRCSKQVKKNHSESFRITSIHDDKKGCVLERQHRTLQLDRRQRLAIAGQERCSCGQSLFLFSAKHGRSALYGNVHLICIEPMGKRLDQLL